MSVGPHSGGFTVSGSGSACHGIARVMMQRQDPTTCALFVSDFPVSYTARHKSDLLELHKADSSSIR